MRKQDSSTHFTLSTVISVAGWSTLCGSSFGFWQRINWRKCVLSIKIIHCFVGAREACLSCHVEDLGYYWYCKKELETGQGAVKLGQRTNTDVLKANSR